LHASLLGFIPAPPVPRAAKVGSTEIVDLAARLQEAAAETAKRKCELAERLKQTVLPLYLQDERERPWPFATCVLARVEGRFYAFTAAHVLEKVVGALTLWAPALNNKLELVPCSAGFLRRNENPRKDLDMGLIPLHASSLGPFAGYTFLEEAEIDEAEKTTYAFLRNFYMVMGYPCSPGQSKVNYPALELNPKSFQLHTNPPAKDLYEQENFDKARHVLVDFDRDDIRINRKKVDPPRLQGVSGGGIFCISHQTDHGPLIAIATDHRIEARVVAGTRIRYFMEEARRVNRTASPKIFE
jgi:hypothetical protein